MKHVILYFGSFNPIHNGHTSVARYVVESGLCDELWFVVSPENPLKPVEGLAPGEDRLEMARIAVSEQTPGDGVRVSGAEFGLPRPSYTIDTLRFLEGEYPDLRFSILAGTDILQELERWKKYTELFGKYRFYIYPRDGYPLGDYAGRVTFLGDAPTLDYSSTDVRRALMAGEDVSRMLSPGVIGYIRDHGLWPVNEAQVRLDALTAEIGRAPSAVLYMERGKLHQAAGRMDKALNDFLKVRELEPDNAEAGQYIAMLREIFAFRYLDYYNP